MQIFSCLSCLLVLMCYLLHFALDQFHDSLDSYCHLVYGLGGRVFGCLEAILGPLGHKVGVKSLQKSTSEGSEVENKALDAPGCTPRKFPSNFWSKTFCTKYIEIHVSFGVCF